MKISFVILCICFSVSAMAQPQPTVSGRTSPVKDTIIILPTNSITLTGTAVQGNPGHPILDTTWTKTSGPAATITKNSNRMTTTVTGLVAGIYVFTLTATDKQNSVDATVTVRVLSGVLPIELAYFHASHNDKGIILTWQTNMELNNSLFIVQKSIDSTNFNDIAVIASKAKNGNSSTQLNYSFQIFSENTQADMHYVVLIITILAAIALISKLNKVYKSLILAIVCLFL